MPCSKGGSPLMKSNHASVGRPKAAAVQALSIAMSTERRGAPSIRLKALRMPDSSTTAITMAWPFSVDASSAALTALLAADALIDRLDIVAAIALLPVRTRKIFEPGMDRFARAFVKVAVTA